MIGAFPKAKGSTMVSSKSIILLLVILLITITQMSTDLYMPSIPSMVFALDTTAARVQLTIMQVISASFMISAGWLGILNVWVVVLPMTIYLTGSGMFFPNAL